MSGMVFGIGDRVLAKAGGHSMEIVSIRAAGAKKLVIYCAWGPPGHRVIQLFQPEQIEKAPKPARTPFFRSLRPVPQRNLADETR